MGEGRDQARRRLRFYRRFTDCMGRKHRVEMTEEEILDRMVYWAGFTVVTALFGAAMVIASGIFI